MNSSILQTDLYLFGGALLGFALFYAQPAAYFLQGNSYRREGKRFRALYLKADALCSLFLLIASVFLLRFRLGWAAFSVLVILPLSLTAVRLFRPQKVKRRFTPRQMRLALCRGILALVLAFPLFLLSRLLLTPLRGEGYALALSALFFLFSEPFTCAANVLVRPVERKIAKKFLRKADKKLRNAADTLRIAVAGSYGKTTVKNMLAVLLQEKGTVFATPASYNTPLGIASAVNGEFRGEKYFIAEMGARKGGDIAELCRLIQPQIGVITAVGEQHVETFGSIHAVYSAKKELADYLEARGRTAYFGGDNALSRRMYAEKKGDKVLAGIEVNRSPLRVIPLKESADGWQVELSDGIGKVSLSLPFYGRHLLADFALSAAVAYGLGVSLSAVADGAKKIRPAPHRMEVIRLSDCIVIDDAYNANFEGAKEALRVLSLFPGRKIVLTPGLVELGERAFERNRQLGEAISKVADLTFITAKENARAILAGLEGEGFPKENVLVTENDRSVASRLAPLRRAGDVLLFLNDLPDGYR